MRRTIEPPPRGLHLGLPGRHKLQLPRAERILVPVNGSSMDHQALELATEIVRPSRGSLFVVYVIEVPRELPLDAPMNDQVSAAEAALAEMEEFCAHQRCHVATELLQARLAGPAVVNEITERGVDLVILGMDHERRFGEFTLGDTVPYVLEHAPCAVWVLREPVA